MDNKEKTKEYIKVMQAYLDGAGIEFSIRNNDRFIKADYPTWDWKTNNYRIKQKELVPGRKYKSVLWEYFYKFIGMDAEMYVFVIEPYINRYVSLAKLPEDIQEVEAQ